MAWNRLPVCSMPWSRSFLQGLGFTKTEADHSVFFSDNKSSFISVYVEDLLIIGEDLNIINELKSKLSESSLHDCRVCFHEVYTLKWSRYTYLLTKSKLHINNLINYLGERIKRIIEDSFFCSSERICLARKFLGYFIYETDAMNISYEGTSNASFDLSCESEYWKDLFFWRPLHQLNIWSNSWMELSFHDCLRPKVIWIQNWGVRA